MNHQAINSQQARTSPEWITHGVMYQIMLRAFTPEGTLKAAQAKLPKLAELGVTILYLCPITVADDDMDQAGWSPRQQKSGMNNPRNPYRIKDYDHIDPEYGTSDDLKAFVQAAHKLKLRVMLDMVYHTCGAKAAILEKHPEFLTIDQDGKVVKNGWNWPRLNFANSELREYFFKNLEMWVREFGVDGFRCDTAIYAPLDFWEEARRRLESIAPDIVMLAESQRPEDQLYAFDCNYSFAQACTLYKIMNREAPASAFRTEWEAVNTGWPSEEVRQRFYGTNRPGFERIEAAWPAGTRFIRYSDNHDRAQDHPKRIENMWGPNAVKATLALIFTLDGVPFLYNGQEVADANTHSIYGKMPIDWSSGSRPIGMERWDFVRNLCSLRRRELALAAGNMEWVEHDRPDEVLVFTRTIPGRRLLVLVNLAGNPIECRLAKSWASPEEVLLGERAELMPNTDSCTGYILGPHGFLVIGCHSGAAMR